ncbi:MAG: major facilitator superfamily domain-containing protein 6 [Chloroflexi bacterium]|nr:major facilitator superfamily domain-containing protein 6 [Chloroflexota bacterium]
MFSQFTVAKSAYFCYSAAMAGFTPFLTLYYAHLGLTASEIGLLIGINPLITLLAAPLWGALADATRQHKRLLLLMIMGTIGIVILFLSATSLAQLLPITIGFGLFTAPMMPLIDNSVLVMLGEQRARYGRFRLWGAVGWGAVGMLGGMLVDRWGLHNSFLTFLVFMSALFLVARQLPITPVSIGERFWQGAANLFADWQWNILLLTVFSSSIALSIINSYLFLYVDQLGGNKTLMGYSLAVGTLSEIPSFFYADRFLKRWGARRVLLVALACQVVRVFAYATMPAAWWILPISLLHGPTFSAMWAASVAYASELAAPRGLVATAQGLLTGVIMGLGGVIGALVGGLVLERWGAVTLFSLAGLGVLAGLLFFAIFGRSVANVSAAALKV